MSARPVVDGVLVVDKAEGPTSHDVVAVARRALGVSRIGHTGTLDPMATGVLPLVIGRATRVAQYLSGGAKVYEATIRFGVTTDTYDRFGANATESDRRPSAGELESALTRFRGAFLQTPPAFSAKNIGGTRAYDRARAHGAAAVQIAPAPVVVSRLELIAFDGNSARLVVEAQAGFYVRSLAHDLGAALGCGAVLDALRRTRSGGFGIDAALRYEDLVTANRDSLRRHLVPFDDLLADRPAVTLDAPSVQRVRHGLAVGPYALSEMPTVERAATLGGADAALDRVVRLLDGEGRLVGLATPAGPPGFLHASVVFG